MRGIELSGNDTSEVKMRLWDAANGDGRLVKITIGGLPPQIEASIRPGSDVMVTGAGADVSILFTSRNAAIGVYPITFHLAWEGGSTTWHHPIQVLSFNAIKALAGTYTSSSSCDSNGGLRLYTSELIANSADESIMIRNFAGLGENVHVWATVDSIQKRIIIKHENFDSFYFSAAGQYTNGPIDAKGQYATETISFKGNFFYKNKEIRDCPINMTRVK